MTFSTIIEWLILIALLVFGIYTMRVIKNEKKVYLENAKTIIFHHFKLLIPHWWGEIASLDSNEIIFKRLDTRYEWEAHFIWFETGSDLNIIELFKEKINERKILFDEDTSIIYNPSDFKDGPIIKTGEYEMVRLEGTATLDRQERLYYDAFLIRHIFSKKYMYAESKSSVLNGLVEGPYFEEVMIRMELVTL